jgi:hypothetical protein
VPTRSIQGRFVRCLQVGFADGKNFVSAKRSDVSMCGGDVQTASVSCRKGMLTCRTRRGWAMCPGEFVGQHVVLRCCRAVGDSTAWRERDRDAQHASTRESRHPYRKTGYRLHAENAADETMAFPSQNQLPDCSLRSPWLHQTRAKLWRFREGAASLRKTAGCRCCAGRRWEWALCHSGSRWLRLWGSLHAALAADILPSPTPGSGKPVPHSAHGNSWKGRPPASYFFPFSALTSKPPNPLAFCTTSLDTRDPDSDPDNPEEVSHGIAEFPSSIHLLSLPTASV